ncbi:hypothetical protein OPQ81_010473 [Rhizoctonia solani]|nr:hypothetical protein OPQ81_010473 [Rhizoctonia solani]
MHRFKCPATPSTLLKTFSSNSVLIPLISVVQDIVRVTQASDRKEWEEFGGYVEKLVYVILHALETNQDLKNGSLTEDFQAFHRTLESISNKIYKINNSPSRRFRIVDVERTIANMRQRLDDAMSLFHVRTTFELLSRSHPLNNSTAQGISQDWASEDFSSLRSDLPPQRGRSTITPRSHRNPTPRPQISYPQVNAVNALKSRFYDQVDVPIRYVDDSRWIRSNSAHSTLPNLSGPYLDNPTDEETHTNRLAATLHSLSDRMASKGNLEDALAMSQGAAGLYRAQAERQMALYYQHRE